MATTTTSISLSPPDFHILSTLDPKPHLLLRTQKSSISLSSPTSRISSKRATIFHNPLHKIKQKTTPIWRIHATASAEAPPLESTAPLDTSQQIVSSGDDNASLVISALLIVGFVGLSILTVGVIYLGVTDFLQKREREKFEKEEEAAGKKKSGKKKKVRARAGPRGFGQKVDEETEFDD
ncbi:hypothetical protein L484_025288 [Morus notabilis]|uniref:Transmembrane protein n=1 Tax=Morus notabilis TaxID=981085 RepID=W9RU85_9ROSA|nr:uncharacterized protein LOC21407992 [Morus notabilis]EXC10704.1 hypothetical protein L484_025288 [Morus notabilis]